MHVLVVDDSSTIRQLVQFTLKTQKDWQIDSAADVKEAIQLCKTNHNYDLFIVDYLLAHETGFDFVRRMRRCPDYNETPVLMLSGEDKSLFRNEIQEHGIKAWLNKPFEPLKLIEVVKKLSPES